MMYWILIIILGISIGYDSLDLYENPPQPKPDIEDTFYYLQSESGFWPNKKQICTTYKNYRPIKIEESWCDDVRMRESVL